MSAAFLIPRRGIHNLDSRYGYRELKATARKNMTQGVAWSVTIAFSTLAVASAVLFRRGRWKLKAV